MSLWSLMLVTRGLWVGECPPPHHQTYDCRWDDTMWSLVQSRRYRGYTSLGITQALGIPYLNQLTTTSFSTAGRQQENRINCTMKEKNRLQWRSTSLTIRKQQIINNKLNGSALIPPSLLQRIKLSGAIFGRNYEQQMHPSLLLPAKPASLFPPSRRRRSLARTVTIYPTACFQRARLHGEN